MEKHFTVQYFIDKFSKIPKRKWTTRTFESMGKMCALGHCNMREPKLPTDEAIALAMLISTNLKINVSQDLEEQTHWVFFTVYPINDGFNDKYLQEHPKERILAALNDIKKMQQQPSNPYPLSASKDLAIKAMEEKLEIDFPVKETIRY